MQRKALIVKFRGAKIFLHPEWSSDRFCVSETLTIKRKSKPKKKDDPLARRIEIPKDTLDTRHVSNLLHVLAGERPKPTLRPFTKIPRDEAIYEMARMSLVKVHDDCPEEIKTVRKAVRDSWHTATLRYSLNGETKNIKGGLIYHARLQRYLGQNLYDDFLSVLKAVSGCVDPTVDFTAHEAIEYLNAHNRDARVLSLASRCKRENKASLANLLAPAGNTESIDIHCRGSNKVDMLLVGAGIEKVRTISGVIFAPVDDARMLDRFRRGGGVATFLEGGYARIVLVDDWSEYLTWGAVPVQEGGILPNVPYRNK